MYNLCLGFITFCYLKKISDFALTKLMRKNNVLRSFHQYVQCLVNDLTLKMLGLCVTINGVTKAFHSACLSPQPLLEAPNFIFLVFCSAQVPLLCSGWEPGITFCAHSTWCTKHLHPLPVSQPHKNNFVTEVAQPEHH